jgi:hypothetical protein
MESSLIFRCFAMSSPLLEIRIAQLKTLSPSRSVKPATTQTPRSLAMAAIRALRSPGMGSASLRASGHVHPRSRHSGNTTASHPASPARWIQAKSAITPAPCSQILNGVVAGLRPLSLEPGRDFDMVAISAAGLLAVLAGLVFGKSPHRFTDPSFI